MTEVITIGLDLAKDVYQVHGVDAEDGVVFRRQLRRGQMLPFFKKQPLCLVGMEACAILAADEVGYSRLMGED